MGLGRTGQNGAKNNKGNQAFDPKTAYADLGRGFSLRKQEYLRRLTTDDETFLKDTINNGVARRRGFLKGRHFGHEGKRPEVTSADIASSGDKFKNNFVCWYDDPATRAGSINPDNGLQFDPLGLEDVNLAIARVTLHAQANDRAKAAYTPATAFKPPPFVRPPSLLEHVATFGEMIGIAAALGVWIPEEVAAAFRNASALSDLADRVKDVMSNDPVRQRDADPDVWVSVPPTVLSPPRIMAGIMSLLPRQLVEDIRSAVYKSTGADIAVSNDADLERFDLSTALRRALNVLAGLSTVNNLPVGRALIELISVIGPTTSSPFVDEDRRSQVAANPFAFAVQMRRPNISLPAGWIWPDWDAAGIYWWRAVLMPACVEHMLSFKDTADFHAVDVLRFYHLFKDRNDLELPQYLFNNLAVTLKAFKFWIDEPPASSLESSEYISPEGKNFLFVPIANGQVPAGPEMTFWSENHQILFASAQFLAGQLFPDDEFTRATTDPAKPVTGTVQMDRSRARIERWLDRRLQFGFSEWNSPVYYNEDFTSLFNLADFTEAKTEDGRRIKEKAAMVLDLLLFDLARFTCRGSFGVTAGRAYWNVKAYGWEQSIGETIEVLFGLRGDFIGGEPAAIALATSQYAPPEVLLAIARDRLVKDRREPFINRSRLSIHLDEAASYGIGGDKDDAVIYWWGNGGYFAIYDDTKHLVEAHPNLANTKPFTLLYQLDNPLFAPVWYELLEISAGYAVQDVGFGLAALLPFPLSVVAWGVGVVGVEFEIEGLIRLIRDLGTVLVKVAKKVLHVITLGLVDDDDEPVRIPESALQEVYKSFLIEFSSGSVLSRANLYSYSNGDTMLSSVQSHLTGKFAAQKHPWEASLGLDACVWTTAPLTTPDLASESQARAWLEFFKDIGTLQPTRALFDVALPEINLAEKLSSDGPGIWNGSVALPLVAQFENVAVIMYNLSNRQRAASPPATHAWFPRMQFDQDEPPTLYQHNGGTWAFAKKDTYDPTDPPLPDPANPSRPLKPGTKTGSGYVGLFSAKPVAWTNTDGNPWNDKELLAEGGANIWVCLVGNQAQFGDFGSFIYRTLQMRLEVSGVGEPVGLHCTFDIPDPYGGSKPGTKLHTIEVEYDHSHVTVDGEELKIDLFPRFENRYAGPSGTIDWGARGYTIHHAETGLVLSHDLDSATRKHTRQKDDTVKQDLSHRRLFDDSLTTLRLPKTQQEQTAIPTAARRRFQ